jgi:hypothetical protein
MTKQYFKVTLKTDIVINASLATEGNMKTLDYIPGSNFLGIVAGDYKQLKEQGKAFDIFHSGAVSFGDAHITSDGSQSYAMPFSLFVDKLNKEVTGNDVQVWQHHVLEKNNYRPEAEDSTTENKKYKQLKQHRSGYLNPNNQYTSKIEKRFALKSAQNRAERKSLDEAMFGFESMKKGQEFIFSVDSNEKSYLDIVTKALTGTKRVGKSKSAQYGQVEIEAIGAPSIFSNQPCQANQLIIYAESNLCVLNEYGQATFQPSPSDFGLDGKGKFNWAASQVRTYSYSPWNAYRNTTDPQRDCIQKGSVLVFEFKEGQAPEIPSQTNIGAFQAEGLGRVLYNPVFLQADNSNGRWKTILQEYKVVKPSKVDLKITSSLGLFLKQRKDTLGAELKIGDAVQKFIAMNGTKFNDISSSQWGGIRNIAAKAESMDDLKSKLFGKDIFKKTDNPGFLMNGVAVEKIWDKKKGKLRGLLLKELLDAKTQKLPPEYFAKLAAEMTKIKQQQKEPQSS